MSGEIEQAAQCPNCEAIVEPEQDDDLVYYPCGCGNEFGYRRILEEPTCAAGIPLGHLATLGGALAEISGKQADGVFLGIPVRRGEDN